MRKAAKKSYRKMVKSAQKSLAKDVLSRRSLGKEVMVAMKRLGLNQTQAARVLRDAPTQLSRLANGNYGEFSVERLTGFLRTFGYKVELRLGRPKQKQRGSAVVRAV
jgi:predicted XRE-type DNA-binding protein